MADRVPGIIVRTPNDTGVIVPPSFQRYPVIVGMGDPYKLVENVQVVRSAGSVDTVPAISTINEIVSVGDLPGISKYIDGTDYRLVAGTDLISWLPGGSSPTLGNTFYVTYTEARAASAYSPILYFDENEVYEDHGGTLRTNSAINDVSQGASLAFDNGAKGLLTLQLDSRSATDPENPTGLEYENMFLAAVDQLEEIEDWKLWLVPMSSGTLSSTTAASILFNHAVLASQPENKQERTVIGAMPANSTYQQYAAFAQSFAHERMVVTAIPSVLQMTGFTGTYDNRYYNAALAGRLCSGYIGETIYDEIISGITFTDNFKPSVQRYLVQNGVCPAKSKGGVIRNVYTGTTDTTSALTEDLGVQDVKDYVKKTWREKLWQVYRNKPITTDLPTQVAASSRGILAKFKSDKTISDYKSIAARQDSTEPRKINVTGKIQPAFGLAYMDVEFTFVLSFD